MTIYRKNPRTHFMNLYIVSDFLNIYIFFLYWFVTFYTLIWFILISHLKISYDMMKWNSLKYPTKISDKGSSSITDNLITFNGISVLNLNLSNILFDKSIICRKVLFSMYYVTFSWATGGIKIWAKCHFIYYILRSYCWSRRPSTITKQSSPLKQLG
jgi:hypothetical protein